MKPLNSRQLRFAEGLVSGLSKVDAYLAAGYKGPRRTAGRNASHLSRKPHIAAHLRQLEAETRARNAATRDRLIAWLWDAVQTPVSEIDECHPLAQEVVHDYRAGEISRARVKSVGKMDAAKLLVAMLGWSGPAKAPAAEKEDPAEMLAALMEGKEVC